MAATDAAPRRHRFYTSPVGGESEWRMSSICIMDVYCILHFLGCHKKAISETLFLIDWRIWTMSFHICCTKTILILPFVYLFLLDSFLMDHNFSRNVSVNSVTSSAALSQRNHVCKWRGSSDTLTSLYQHAFICCKQLFTDVPRVEES